MTEVNYVDQVFLCFFLSLKLVTISDKENYERCYLENYVFCIPCTRLNIIFAYLSVLLSRLLLNLILKRYLHCLNSTSNIIYVNGNSHEEIKAKKNFPLPRPSIFFFFFFFFFSPSVSSVPSFPRPV